MLRTQTWLPLKQAAAFLGVDQSTLRHWADSGRVPVYRTPGGHRRFRERDLRGLLRVAPSAKPDPGSAFRRRTAHPLAGLPTRRLHSAPWFARLGKVFRGGAGARGREVITLLSEVLDGTVERPAGLTRIGAMGREYGYDLRLAGLTLAQAVEAFAFFRDLVMTRTLSMESAGKHQVRLFHDLGRLLDRMLLALVLAYEEPGKPVP